MAATSAQTDIRQPETPGGQLAELERKHAIATSINALLLGARSKDQVLQEACRVAVDVAGARMAWVGFSDPGGNKVTPAASHGDDGGYLARVGTLLETNVESRYLTGWSMQVKTWDSGAAALAARDGLPVVCHDIETDPRIVFRQAALEQGYRSLIALPLEVHGERIGMLMAFGDEPGRFDEDEAASMGQLAASLGFALGHLSAEHQLSFVSWYDSVTELPNRALFVDRLTQLMRHELAAARSVSVLLFDLQRFREVNVAVGREGGDHVLKVFAGRLRTVFGGMGMVARLSGDQFAVAVRGTRIAALSTLGDERWDGSLVAPLRIGGDQVRVAFKLGISAAPSDGDSPEALLRHAEAALHVAKQSRPAYAFYSASMAASSASRLELERRLREAVEQRQFQLHYQPRIDLASRALVGAEALIRWPDGEGGLRSADEFIPALEETGLIVEVGRWAIEQAVADIRRWRAHGLEAPRVSVNVSPVQLSEADFVGKVLAAVGGPGSLIDLEITERELHDELESAVEKLRQLRELGMKIIMDDFGTGSSSLAMLARLPIDVVKIDRSFVAEMEQQPAALAIASAVVGLARSLHMTAVAEGVETEAAAALLRQLGCSQGQGFLFGKAMPANELARSLALPRS